MTSRPGPKRVSVTGIKRRQANDDGVQLQLERVFGVTLSSNCALCFDSVNSVLAYPAGCTIVLYNVLRREQHFIINPSKKVITCLDMSSDGKFLVSGEFGHNPAVRIWELSTRSQLAEFGGHKFAIACVRFSRSADQRFVVSIGNQFDQSVSVWNWRTHKQAASNRNTAKIYAVAFAPTDQFFVTVGVRHVRFWSIQSTSTTQSHSTVPLSGRNAILGDVQNNVFIDVACACIGGGRAQPTTFALTQSGTVCQFDERRVLTRCIDARPDTARPTCLCLFGEMLFVGAFDGQVAAYSATTLQLAALVPKPHNVFEDAPTLDTSIDAEYSSQLHIAGANGNGVKYPDVVALAADPRNGFLASVYNDHSIYVWNIAPCDNDAEENEKDSDGVKSGSISVSVEFSSRAHSKCVWHVEIYPFHFELNSLVSLDGSAGNASLDQSNVASDPLSTSCSSNASLFVTCGNDCTLRFWRVANDSASLIRTVAIEADSGALLDANIAAYTNQFDQQTAINGDIPISFFGSAATGSPRVAGSNPARAGRNTQAVVVNAASNNAAGTNSASEPAAAATQSSKTGLKVARFKPDGRELAVGDRVGNVRVFRVSVFEALASVYVEPAQLIAAHDNEVTALEYLLAADCCLLATASRDRMIHIFDSTRGYDHLQTLDEHSSVVNAIRFIVVPPNNAQQDSRAVKRVPNISSSPIATANVRCVSCSADHSLLFRTLLTDETGHCRFVLAQNTAVKTALYDIDSDSERAQLCVVGQDRFVRSFCADTCKPTRQFRVAVSEHGGQNSGSTSAAPSGGANALTAFPIRVANAPNGAFTALALTNKDVQLYDSSAASLVAAANGHGELVLGLRFSHDSRKLVTVAGDGCVFVWRITTPADRRKQLVHTSQSATSSPLRRPTPHLAAPIRTSLPSANAMIDHAIDKSWRVSTDSVVPQSMPDAADMDQVPCRDVSVSNAQAALSFSLNGSLDAGSRVQRVAGAWAQRAAGEPLVIKSRLDQSGALTLTVDQLLAFNTDSSLRRISMDGSVCTVDLAAEHSMNSSTTGVYPSYNEQSFSSRDRSLQIGAERSVVSAIKEERESARDVVDGQSAIGDTVAQAPVQAADKDDQLTASTPISEVLTLPESDRDLFDAQKHEAVVDPVNVRTQIEHWLDDVDTTGAEQLRSLNLHAEQAAGVDGEVANKSGDATAVTSEEASSTPIRDASCFDIEAAAATNRYVETSIELLNAYADPEHSTAQQLSSVAANAAAFEYQLKSGVRETYTQRFLQMARYRTVNRQLRFAVGQNACNQHAEGAPSAGECDSASENVAGRNRLQGLAGSFDQSDLDCDCDDLFTIVTGLGYSRTHRSATSSARTAKDCGDRRVRSVSDVEMTSFGSTSAAEPKPRGTAFRILGSPMRNTRNAASQKAAASTTNAGGALGSPARRFTPGTRNSFTRQRQLVGSPAKVNGRVTSVPSQLAVVCPLRDQLGYVHAMQTHVEKVLEDLLRQLTGGDRARFSLQAGAVATAIQLVGLTEQNASAAIEHCKTLRIELEQRLPKQSNSGNSLRDLTVALPATATAAEHKIASASDSAVGEPEQPCGEDAVAMERAANASPCQGST